MARDALGKERNFGKREDSGGIGSWNWKTSNSFTKCFPVDESSLKFKSYYGGSIAF